MENTDFEVAAATVRVVLRIVVVLVELNGSHIGRFPKTCFHGNYARQLPRSCPPLRTQLCRRGWW